MLSNAAPHNGDEFLLSKSSRGVAFSSREFETMMIEFYALIFYDTRNSWSVIQGQHSFFLRSLKAVEIDVYHAVVNRNVMGESENAQF